MKQWTQRAGAVVIGAAALSAQAALIDRGNGMVYDSTQNITWLSDMNFARTSGSDADGKMTYDQAMVWAANLVHAGYSDWRLPTLGAFDTSCSSSFWFGTTYYEGTGCTGGELSHLFVTDLGNTSGSVLNQAGDSAAQVANLAKFSNVQSFAYWSATPLHASNSFMYISATGNQGTAPNTSEYFAVAVRDGDVAAAVPEPQALALMLAGLGAVVLVAQRRKPSPRT